MYPESRLGAGSQEKLKIFFFGGILLGNATLFFFFFYLFGRAWKLSSLIILPMLSALVVCLPMYLEP